MGNLLLMDAHSAVEVSPSLGNALDNQRRELPGNGSSLLMALLWDTKARPFPHPAFSR
jgi:hypothetical protein